MKRTTLTLTDELALVLEREARRHDTSVSQIARAALSEHFGLSGQRPPRPRFPILGHSGGADTSERIEEILAEEWSDPRRR